jgi:peptidoglycan hydrolase CwlO-like protein
MEDTTDSQAQLEEIKSRISEVQSKPVDTHSQEFEGIHADLNRVLSEIDGL